MKHECNEEKIRGLIHKLRLTAGEIGIEILGENESGSEATHYEACVGYGLSEALLEILQNDFEKFHVWLVDCICNHQIQAAEPAWPIVLALEISDPKTLHWNREPQEVRETAVAELHSWIEKNPLPQRP